MGNLWRMETLRAYLGTLTPDEQSAYAQRAGTTIGYLRKAMSVGQRFDGALARLLDEESGGEVRRSDLRPDIWPEGESSRPVRIDTPEAAAAVLPAARAEAPPPAEQGGEDDPDASRYGPAEETA